jgi:hypothetical protein
MFVLNEGVVKRKRYWTVYFMVHAYKSFHRLVYGGDYAHCTLNESAI